MAACYSLFEDKKYTDGRMFSRAQACRPLYLQHERPLLQERTRALTLRECMILKMV